MCSCVLIKLYVTCRQVESLHFNFWVVFFHSSFQFTNCNIRNHATLKQCSIIELLILHICTEIILSFFQICVSDLGSSIFSLKLVHPEVTVLSIAYCKSNGSWFARFIWKSITINQKEGEARSKFKGKGYRPRGPTLLHW